MQGAVAAQFHEIAFAMPMLAFASAAFVERRWVAVTAWSAPLVLVKEDMGLTVLMIGGGRHPHLAGAGLVPQLHRPSIPLPTTSTTRPTPTRPATDAEGCGWEQA